jgi:hypothetical protein
MNLEQMDNTFSQGLRAALVEQVNASSSARARRHHWLIGAGAFAGVGLIGGVGAATAGFFTEPGADIVTTIDAPVTGTYIGTQIIELGAPPEGATHIRVQLTCVNGSGTLYWEDGANMTCDGEKGPSTSYMAIPLAPGQRSTEVQASDPRVSYDVEATYINQTPTAWAVNENGDTYGAINERGEPDLVSAIASNGKLGYVYSKDLQGPEINNPEEALEYMESVEGTTLMVPVYESDGETVIGEFEAGSW